MHFARIRKKALKLGLQNNDILTLEIIQKQQKPINLTRITTKLFCSLFVVGLLVGGTLFGGFFYGFTSGKWLSEQWANYVMPKDVGRECLIPTLDTLVGMFRPPLNCSFCEGIGKADRVANLTQEEFIEKYAYSGRVTVVTDGTKDWSAAKYFSLNFFKQVYKDNSSVLDSSTKECQFFRYNTGFNNLRQVFTMAEEMQKMKGKSWYIGWRNCDPKVAMKLRKYYKKPYFFPDEIQADKSEWIFMGTPGYGAHMHIDDVTFPSWQAQIQGTKIWTIEPPPECYYKCPGTFRVVVNPGDIIILNTNKWFHQTDIIGKNISITIGSEYD